MNRHERRVAAKQQKQPRYAPEQALKKAIDLHQQQRFAEAEKIYRPLLALHAKNADVLHYYGVLLHQTGRSEQAIAYIKQALAIVPTYLDAFNNLGNVLKETGDVEGAVAAYRQVLKVSPNHAGVHNNLGTALRSLRQYEESISLLKKALQLSPNNPDVLQNLANSYQDNHDYQQAVDAYRQSLAINPQQKLIYQRLWHVLSILGQTEASQDILAQWLSVEPDNHIAQHYFQANAGYTPERASDGYIKETFDRFATSFDNVLHGLEYRAPTLVGQVVEKLFSGEKKLSRVLDAGCGTGLSGIPLRAYADELIGVDLSQGMLDKAEQRHIYDALVQADLVSYISAYNGQFDLIISADTLVYFGALDSFLQSASHALTARGTLIFTVEKHDAEDGFQLNYHGRYAHTPRYISDTLNHAGFELRDMETVVLRKERGEPVVGLLVSALLRQ